MKKKYNYILVELSKLKLNEDNPRVIKDDKFELLKNSIISFPEMLKIRPIIVDENYNVLGGFMRTKACMSLGLDVVPVFVVKNLTEEQKREILIKDNVSFGEWEWETLYRNNTREDLKNFGLDVWISDSDEEVGSNAGVSSSNPDQMPERDFDIEEENTEVYTVICPNCATEFQVKM